MDPEILVEQITIKNFRNHTQYKLNNSEAIVVLNGDNGVGKTNILEAISFLGPGRGLRKAKSNDIFSFSEFLSDFFFISFNKNYNIFFFI